MTARASSLALAGLALWMLTAPVAAQVEAVSGDTVEVTLDLATLMKVPPETATIVIGNPAIADAAIQRNGLLVVTGKSFGSTNLLALDDQGAPVRELMVRVRAGREPKLTVQRGFSRETWTCMPRCEQTVTLGDAPEFFGSTTGQVNGRNGFAQGAAAANP